MKRVFIAVVSVMFVCGLSINASQALPPFKKAFKEKYVDSGPESLKADFKKASCNACHIKGEKKTKRNSYGEELDKLIEGNAKKRLADAKDAGNQAEEKVKIIKELEKAMEEVEKKKPADDQPTYGEQLKDGQLPVPLES